MEYFDEEFKITSKDHNFHIAFAFVSSSNDPSMLKGDLRRYGEVKPFFKMWEHSNDADGDATWTEIESRPCTKKDILVDEGGTESAKFYKLSESSKTYTEYYADRLMCIDEEIEIYGAFNSVKAKHLSINFVKCDPAKYEGTCASEQEITDYIRGGWIITLENIKQF